MPHTSAHAHSSNSSVLSCFPTALGHACRTPHIHSENEGGRGLSDSAVVGATSEMIDEEEGLLASAGSGGRPPRRAHDDKKH